MVCRARSACCWQGVASSQVCFCETAACCLQAQRGLGGLIAESVLGAVLRIVWKEADAVCNLCALMEVLQPGGKALVSSGCLAGCAHCIGRLHPARSGKWMHSHKTALVSSCCHFIWPQKIFPLLSAPQGGCRGRAGNSRVLPAVLPVILPCL